MNAASFDSLQFVRILRDKGSFTTEQAESIADAMASTLHDDLATKSDIVSVKSDIVAVKSDIIAVRSDIVAVKSELSGDLRELELRLETRIAESKSDILKWMFGTIGFQTIVILGAVVSLAHVAR